LSYFVKGAAYLNIHVIAEKFRQLIEQNMRNNRVYLILATQDMKQIPTEMLTACLNLKNFLFGSQADPATARYLADRFMVRDPWRVKYWERVWASETHSAPRAPSYTTHFVIDHRPIFMPLEEQNYLDSRDFMNLRKGEWLFAESIGEGEIATSVRKIISPSLFAGPFVSENKDLLQQLRLYLTRRDGVPLESVLAEIETQQLPVMSDTETGTAPIPNQSLSSNELPDPGANQGHHLYQQAATRTRSAKTLE
jgi:hypothetical protein